MGLCFFVSLYVCLFVCLFVRSFASLYVGFFDVIIVVLTKIKGIFFWSISGFELDNI